VLLKNNAGEGHHWLGVHLQGTSCNRDAIGAILTWSFGGTTRRKLKIGGGSYLSSTTPARCSASGGDDDGLARDQVARPERPHETFTDLPIDRYVTIVEGKGRIAPRRSCNWRCRLRHQRWLPRETNCCAD
jgi:enediyne biosynthesis protein E4